MQNLLNAFNSSSAAPNGQVLNQSNYNLCDGVCDPTADHHQPHSAQRSGDKESQANVLVIRRQCRYQAINVINNFNQNGN